jgi:hypothetical protein
MELIGDVIFVFFIVVVFTMVRRGIYMMEWTILRVMLRRWLFTVFATVIGTKGFEMTRPLALETYAASHIWRKDLVNEQRWNFIGKRGGQRPKGRSMR